MDSPADYNLLRTVMAIAANENDIEPREVSLKGAMQVRMENVPSAPVLVSFEGAGPRPCQSSGLHQMAIIDDAIGTGVDWNEDAVRRFAA